MDIVHVSLLLFINTTESILQVIIRGIFNIKTSPRKQSSYREHAHHSHQHPHRHALGAQNRTLRLGSRRLRRRRADIAVCRRRARRLLSASRQRDVVAEVVEIGSREASPGRGAGHRAIDGAAQGDRTGCGGGAGKTARSHDRCRDIAAQGLRGGGIVNFIHIRTLSDGEFLKAEVSG